MEEIVELGTIFLLAGTIYSDVPTAKIDQIRTKNRRLGLGLMGIHEFLLKRGHKYGANDELAKYLEVYTTSTDISHKWADSWDISRPLKTRAIAPTGTIGIVAETTTGVEPIFCVAYKRRYLKHKTWNYQYVIDPTAKRLIDSGVKPDMIEDAYSLAEDVERRVAFQAWLQAYVDHSISSTINLPAWGSELNNENRVVELGTMFYKYLPRLRGITVYADGSRGGQPLTPIKYQTAIKHVGETFTERVEKEELIDDVVVYEGGDVCDITKGGSCGA
jgi:ribonucleoside-diphosphate reductase alpha chain